LLYSGKLKRDKIKVVFMDRLKIGSWVIEVDVNKTKAFYDKQPLITQDWDSVFEEN